MTTLRYCSEYERLLERQVLLGLLEMCGARVANPEIPGERLERHANTCAECRALAQARREATRPTSE